MNKDGGVKFLCGAPDRLKCCVIQVQKYLRVRNADLHQRAFQSPRRATRVRERSVQFACGEVGVLHWNSSKTR